MYRRSERVSELLRQEISQFVQEINDPRLGFVTITGVKVTDDLTEAKVFYSVFGSDEEREITSKILIHYIPSMRRAMGKRLESLYRAPALYFVYDNTPEKAQKVFTILDQLSKEEKPEIQASEGPQPAKPERKRAGRNAKGPA